jgi:DNA-binding NtrC family response regulator
VDDEPDAVGLCARVFRSDYELLTATSGREALEIVRGRAVAAAIVDQRMPGMSGVEVLLALAESHPRTARIAMTAHTQLENIVALINQGRIHAFVVKPWNNHELRQTVGKEVELYVKKREVDELSLKVLREHRDMLAILRELEPEFAIPGSNEELKAAKRRLATRVGGEVERMFLKRLVDQARGSVTRAARRAGMNRTFLYRLLKRHKLPVP